MENNTLDLVKYWSNYGQYKKVFDKVYQVQQFTSFDDAYRLARIIVVFARKNYPTIFQKEIKDNLSFNDDFTFVYRQSLDICSRDDKFIFLLEAQLNQGWLNELIFSLSKLIANSILNKDLKIDRTYLIMDTLANIGRIAGLCVTYADSYGGQKLYPHIHSIKDYYGVDKFSLVHEVTRLIRENVMDLDEICNRCIDLPQVSNLSWSPEQLKYFILRGINKKHQKPVLFYWEYSDRYLI